MTALRLVAVGGWRVPYEALAGKVRLDLCPECAADLRRLVDAAELVARPRAVWMTVDEVAVSAGGRVRVGAEHFQSDMLAHNLAGAPRVWPFLATCGPELDSLADQPGLAGVFEDPLAEFWLDSLKALALDAAFEALRREVLAVAGSDRLSVMNPGSGNVALWDIGQQVPLFRLLGDEAVRGSGVVLGDSCLMSPNKSVSGLFFHGAEDFDSCAYCERQACPGRRLPYRPGPAGAHSLTPS